LDHECAGRGTASRARRAAAVRATRRRSDPAPEGSLAQRHDIDRGSSRTGAPSHRQHRPHRLPGGPSPAGPPPRAPPFPMPRSARGTVPPHGRADSRVRKEQRNNAPIGLAASARRPERLPRGTENERHDFARAGGRLPESADGSRAIQASPIACETPGRVGVGVRGDDRDTIRRRAKTAADGPGSDDGLQGVNTTRWCVTRRSRGAVEGARSRRSGVERDETDARGASGSPSRIPTLSSRHSGRTEMLVERRHTSFTVTAARRLTRTSPQGEIKMHR